jgi:hypothetical protein
MAQCTRTAAPTILVRAGHNRQSVSDRCCATTPIAYVHMQEVPEEEECRRSRLVLDVGCGQSINTYRLGGMPV